MNEGDTWRRRLELAIEDRRLVPSQVSEQAGFHRQYLSKVVRGELNPTVERLERICEAVGIRISYLFVEAEASTGDPVEKLKNLPEEEAQRLVRLLASSKDH